VNYQLLFRYLLGFAILFCQLKELPATYHPLQPVAEESFYPRDPSIPNEIWNEAKPYFLPEDHPIKKNLDRLFEQSRLLDSLEVLRDAGFKILNANSELDVAFHPDLSGYVIKFYLDGEDNRPYFNKLKLQDRYISEVRLWLLRIGGAKRIQQIIDSHHYTGIMKVSKQWIYPLPLEPKATGPFPKYFIYVEEDMKVVDDVENKRRYREEMNPYLLKAFFTVLKKSRFYDSVYIDNNPFSTDGRIAFVDTEEYDRKPVPFEKVLKWLSPEMQIYWKELMTAEDKN
jgi:hypothetical protein